MAFNLLLNVFLVLFYLSLTSVYSLSTRDVVSKQDDESYFMLTASDQGSSMVDIEDLEKARSLQPLISGSKVVVNKAIWKRSPKKSKKGSEKEKKPNNNKVGSFTPPKKFKIGSLYVSALVGIIIIVASIVVTIVIIICVICCFCMRHKTKKAKSTGQEQIKGSSETRTSKTEEHV